jgi:hypothetical protein
MLCKEHHEHLRLPSKLKALDSGPSVNIPHPQLSMMLMTHGFLLEGATIVLHQQYRFFLHRFLKLVPLFVAGCIAKMV